MLFPKSKHLKIKQNIPLLLLIGIWISVQFILFNKFGITTKNEAIRYIENGTLLLNKNQIIDFHLFYSFYSLLIAINIFFTKSFIPIIILQLIINAISTTLFYKIISTLSSNSTAYITTLILILFYPIQQWNIHLYTESIFISEIIILVYLLLNLDFTKLKSSIIISVIFFVTFFTRPSAVYLSIPILFYIIINYKLFNANKIGLALILISIILLTAKSIIFNLEYLNQQVNQALNKSWVIYGYENIKITTPKESKFLWSMEIIYLRALYYFGMIRPYFNKIHNITLILFYPVYIFALIGAVSKTNSPRKIRLLIIMIIGAFATATILTFINWQGRFIAPIIPLFLMLGAIGFERIKNTTLGRYNHKIN